MIFAGPRNWFDRALSTVLWLLWIVPVAVAIGSACALFLWSLDAATKARFQHPWLLFLLPFAGIAVGATYQFLGKSAEGGNNLIVDQIHEPGGGVPRRMAPLILATTVVTHLFGGSAGREGTAVQMGGSIASAFGRWVWLDARGTRTLLMAGATKQDGIINAVAHHTHYGYSKGGKIRANDPEAANPDLTMCVELIGQRAQLELFCRRHGDMLNNKVVIYKHPEHREVHSNELEAHNASIKELKSSVL